MFQHLKKMVPASACVLVLSMAALASAQIPSIGFCPEYLPMVEFDMERFLGKWYEAERYFTFSEVASRCVVTDYARGPSGRICVSNEVTNRITGVKRVIGGVLELVGKGNEGRMNVKYSTTPLATESTLTVLETDYDNFAVIWSCSGIGPVHAQNAWVMTRERLAPGTVLQKAYGVLDKFRINRAFFVKTDQEGCAIVASDINAANGIIPSSTVPQAIGVEQKQIAAKPNVDPTPAERAAAEVAEKVKIAEKEDSAETKKQPQTVAEIILNNAAGDAQEMKNSESQDVKKPENNVEDAQEMKNVEKSEVNNAAAVDAQEMKKSESQDAKKPENNVQDAQEMKNMEKSEVNNAAAVDAQEMKKSESEAQK